MQHTHFVQFTDKIVRPDLLSFVRQMITGIIKVFHRIKALLIFSNNLHIPALKNPSLYKGRARCKMGLRGKNIDRLEEGLADVVFALELNCREKL